MKLEKIYYCTWGATMILVDFYRIVKETPKTIVLQMLKTEKTETGFLTGTVIPIMEDDNKERNSIIRAYKKGACLISRSKGFLQIFDVWDGDPIQYDHCD